MRKHLSTGKLLDAKLLQLFKIGRLKKRDITHSSRFLVLKYSLNRPICNRIRALLHSEKKAIHSFSVAVNEGLWADICESINTDGPFGVDASISSTEQPTLARIAVIQQLGTAAYLSGLIESDSFEDLLMLTQLMIQFKNPDGKATFFGYKKNTLTIPVIDASLNFIQISNPRELEAYCFGFLGNACDHHLEALARHSGVGTFTEKTLAKHIQKTCPRGFIAQVIIHPDQLSSDIPSWLSQFHGFSRPYSAPFIVCSNRDALLRKRLKAPIHIQIANNSILRQLGLLSSHFNFRTIYQVLGWKTTATLHLSGIHPSSLLIADAPSLVSVHNMNASGLTLPHDRVHTITLGKVPPPILQWATHTGLKLQAQFNSDKKLMHDIGVFLLDFGSIPSHKRTTLQDLQNYFQIYPFKQFTKLLQKHPDQHGILRDAATEALRTVPVLNNLNMNSLFSFVNFAVDADKLDPSLILPFLTHSLPNNGYTLTDEQRQLIRFFQFESACHCFGNTVLIAISET